MAIALIGCANDPNNPPRVYGGSGSVISLKDGGVVDGGGGHGGQSQAGGHGGGAGGAGGSTVVGTGSGGAGGTSVIGTGLGGSTSVGGGSGSVGAGGAAGAGIVLDPCTACEKARCGNPVGLGTATSNLVAYQQLATAYDLCFVGTGWPTGFTCSPSSESSSTATNGPEAGTAKTTLCQDLLKCIHQTGCAGDIYTVDVQACYCGAGVSLSTCQSTTFTPTGVCKDQVEAALEFSVATPAVFGAWADICRANGAAIELIDNCDSNCCPEECYSLSSTDAYSDPSFCTATSSGGTSGSGGTPGSGGATGTGGTLGGTGGATGTGGTVVGGSGGGLGGTPGSGGAAAGGSPGTGGTATAGSTGSGGTILLQNGQFDTSTAGWTPSYGATESHSPSDAAGNPQSGSLDLILTGSDPTLSVEVAASQCISAVGGASYGLSVEVMVPATATNVGALGLWFFTSGDCSGSLAGSSMTPSSTTNGWQKVTSSEQAPAGAHSMAVRLELFKPIGPSSAEALFDAVSVTQQ